MGNIITPVLPHDLPENWNDTQYVSPGGTEVGLTEKHGYNYLMKQVNNSQKAINELDAELEDIHTTLQNKADTSSVYTKTESDNLLQNNDPRQWGLGKDGIPIVNKATLDGLFIPGWYMFYDTTNTLDNGIRSGLVEVKGRNTSITSICVQEIWADDFIYGGGLPYKAERKWDGSAWSPLEWFNPPMILDAEYRTTERFKGKPIYKMLVSCDRMPNNGEKIVKIGSYETSEQIAIIDVKAWMSYASDGYGSWSMNLPYMSNDDTAVTAIACGVATGVRFEAKKSYGDNYYGFAIVSYIKTYD